RSAFHLSPWRITAAVSDWRDLQRPAIDRSTAPARSLHGVDSAVHSAAWRAQHVVRVLWLSGRAGARTGRFHASRVGFRESIRDAVASLAGFDTHQLWPVDDGAHLSLVQVGRVDLQRARARRESLQL